MKLPSFISKSSILFAFLLCLPALAQAHPGHSTSGFAAGLAHPLHGLDHILAMIAVGLWATQLGGRALFLATILLICTMIGAIVLGLLGSLVFAKLFPSPNPNTGSYLVPASLPFFLIVIALGVAGYLVVRIKLSQRLGSPTLALAGLLFWLLLAVITAALLPVGSTIFTLPAMAAILVAFLPIRAWWAKLLPAALATILFVPNIVLAFLGTGMETLMLVTLLAAILAELWATLRYP